MSPELVQKLCNRHFGVGADGVLTVTEVDGFDGEMRIFNADGGEAEMCGNGLRCVATYLDDVGEVKKNTYRIKTMNNNYLVIRQGNGFAIRMSEIKDQNLHDLSGFKEFQKSFFVNTGVPHLVFLGRNIKELDIKKVAAPYRFNPMFSGGTNVSFVEVLGTGNQLAYVRTYERGVEDETFSCGTGLTATGLALAHWFGWNGSIQLTTLGGKHTIEIGQNVLFSGEVTCCFKGEASI